MHTILRQLSRSRSRLLAAAVLVALCHVPVAARAATITVVNNDGPGEGLNDTTPTAPVGGNTGTTLGQQRSIALQYAADLFAARLLSNVDIVVEAEFNSLSCGSSSGVLGSAGPLFVNRDFPGAPLPLTWYSSALANSLTGSDLIPSGADIGAQFNRDLGQSGCLTGISFYLGLDADPGGDVDLVTVAAHELAHGLGVVSLVDAGTGSLFGGYSDVYVNNLEDHSLGLTWPNMTNSERKSSAVDTGDLHWVGPSVTSAAAAKLSSGVGAGGHVEMFAPAPLQSGSSVSHFSTALFPDEAMEPSYTGPNHDLDLTVALLADVGWPVAVEFCGSGVVDPGEDCDDGNLTNGDGCDANCTVTSCGNAIVTTGEDCDDGNLDNGDCCDDGCSYESAGSPCMGGAGSCTAAGVCELPPVCGDGVVGTGEECDDGNLLDGDCCSAACTLPTGCATGARAVLVVKDRSNPAADAIVWKLAKGDELAHGLLGDPTATTSYTLCVFDERSAGTSLAAALTVGPDAATWIDKNPNGYVYKDRDGTADGVRKVKIKPGVAGKSKVLIKAKGAAVPLPAAAGPDRIFDQNPRVRVFVVADDVTTCWSTDFPVSSTKKNRVSSFKAVR